MSRNGQILLFILLLLLSLSGGYWFYNNFTWVEETKDVGFQGEAKSNNLLAAEFFLRKMGVPVQQISALTAFRDLPSAKHTILITTQRETINTQLSDRLLAWVRSGGHLIVLARYLSDANEYQDDLLSRWQIFLSADNDNGEKKGDKHQQQKSEPLSLVLDSTRVQVQFPQKLTLKSAVDDINVSWQIQRKGAYYLLQLPLEQGMITVLSSMSIFYNQSIADYDHARLLHYLVQQQDGNEGVWLIRIDDMPPLWQWLWHNAWYVMLPLIVLLFFWLWRAPLRFGRLLNDVPPHRRSLLEHITASGYYRWHNNQSDYLLTQVQDRLWDSIQRIHPAIRREYQTEAYSQLAAITGVNEALISDALQATEMLNEQNFTRKIKLLELIRKNL